MTVFDKGVFDSGVLDAGLGTISITFTPTAGDDVGQMSGTVVNPDRITGGQPLYWRDRQLQQIYAEDDELIQILTKVLEAA